MLGRRVALFAEGPYGRARREEEMVADGDEAERPVITFEGQEPTTVDDYGSLILALIEHAKDTLDSKNMGELLTGLTHQFGMLTEEWFVDTFGPPREHDDA